MDRIEVRMAMRIISSGKAGKQLLGFVLCSARNLANIKM
jgi:hypothetical protein